MMETYTADRTSFICLCTTNETCQDCRTPDKDDSNWDTMTDSDDED